MYLTSYSALLMINFVSYYAIVLSNKTENATHERMADRLYKIKNGFDTTIMHYPSFAGLFRNNWCHCGATILSSATVLTAGHCVRDRNPAIYKIRTGTSYRDFHGFFYFIKDINVHPKFNSDYLYYDFALLTTYNEIIFTERTQSVPLVNSQVPADSEVVAVGWGLTEIKEVSRQLKSIQIYTISLDTCKSRLPYYAITKSMLCAEDRVPGNHRQDTCSGDSGGPLYYMNSLAGVTSWGDCNKEEPSVYSNVFEVRDWIENNLVDY